MEVLQLIDGGVLAGMLAGRRKPLLVLVVLVGGSAQARGDEPPVASAATAPEAQGSAPISFNEHIRPIFAAHCVACHGGVKQAGGVSFIYREMAVSAGDSGLTPITPGSLEESYLIDRVSDSDPETRMPPADHGPPLSEHEIYLLRRWIEQGAKWELHWSFVPPQPQSPPEVQEKHWPRDPLDRFILARQEAEGLAPAAEADRTAWLRRVSLDLIGLPPSPEE
jgi:hypothetical protein